MTISSSGNQKPVSVLDLLAIVFLFGVFIASFLISPVTMSNSWPPRNEAVMRHWMEWTILASMAFGLWRSHEIEDRATRRLLGFLLVLGLFSFIVPLCGSASSRAGVDWPEAAICAVVCVAGGVYARQRILLFSTIGLLAAAIVYFFWWY